MRIKEFVVRNFKGIKIAKVELSGDVITLVGLNESGKTTILEAISHYVSTDKNTNELVKTVHKSSSLQEIIPVTKKAAFNDKVSIKATVELDEEDVSALREVYKGQNLKLDTTLISRVVSIEKVYIFEDSQLQSTMSYWNINFPIVVSRKKDRRQIGEKIDRDKEEKILWLAGVDVLEERHPKIAYFPTFLFDFPDRIYISDESLEKSSGDSTVNSYYSQVIHDVLEGSNLNVKKHIIDRINKIKGGDDVAFTFLSKFASSVEKRQIDDVMQKASSEITRVIFGAWNNILGRKAAGKRIQIDWSIDTFSNNSVVLEIFIIDGESRYSISERSLGFRWFFSFLLLTQFRRNRKDGGSTIFLFDEPASNLHPKAQVKLLDSFSKIAGDLTKIIYSTHSHYMINPMWLEDAYIVSNEVVDLEDEYDLSSVVRAENDIIATKYRTFVGRYPSQTTYFQPVLDALDVGFSPLISASNAIIVEGKYDYFPIIYFGGGRGQAPQIFPVNGAGNASRLISLFRGWGVNFSLLLDGDNAGISGKKKYKYDYQLSDDEVITIGEIDGSLIGKTFEDIYMNDVREEIRRHFSISDIEKRHFSLFFQEAVNKDRKYSFPETEAKLAPILAWIQRVKRNEVLKG